MSLNLLSIQSLKQIYKMKNTFINYIQLKSARCVLNLGVRDIGELIGTSRTTISKIENNLLSPSQLRLAERRNNILETFFKKNSIFFPNYYTISTHNNSDNTQTVSQQKNVLTRFQLRVARTIINNTILEFSTSIGEKRGIIEYAESLTNNTYISPKNNQIINKIKLAFKQHGIEFPDNFTVTFKKIVDTPQNIC